MTLHSPRMLHLAAFVAAGPVSGHHGGWRHGAADRGLLSLQYYQRIAQILEAAKFDLVFLPDILGVPDRLGNSLDSQLRHGALGALRLDPMVVLSVMAASTAHLGLAATLSTTYHEPYLLARALATLDHLSGGRAAWNIVTSFQEAEARNFGQRDLPDRAERYERADEFVEVVCKLWDSWRDDALVLDPVAPLFADPAKVSPIDHRGKWFDVRGPLNVSRSPQGRPVLLQAGASSRGRDFAARWADVVFVTPASQASAWEFYRDLKQRAACHGRDPEDIRILPALNPIVGETTRDAEEKRAALDRLAAAEAGLSTLSYHLGIDLSIYPQDEVLPLLDVPGVDGHYREVAELSHSAGLSLSEIGARYGRGSARVVVGSASDIADRIEAWFTAGAADGFMLQPAYLPGALEDFVRLVVPELRKRGLFRTEYEFPTLRGQLGIARPVA